MSSGDGQAAVPDQLAEHFGIAEHRNTEFCADSSGLAAEMALLWITHSTSALTRSAACPENTGSCLLERIVVGDGQVRTAQPPAFLEKDPRQGTHAGTADSNQVGPHCRPVPPSKHQIPASLSPPCPVSRGGFGQDQARNQEAMKEG